MRVVYLYLIMPSYVLANNSIYITLSNQLARKVQLEIVTNNTANANTIGYEADSLAFGNADMRQSSKRSHSFVQANRIYKSEQSGELQITGRPLDLAIAGPGYFKVLTAAGPRYTLNGAMLVNSNYMLVNANGDPYLGSSNQAIALPEEYSDLQVSQDGVIFVGPEAIETIGVFYFEKPDLIEKEGNSLYVAKTPDYTVEDFTIISGALRKSNVNNAKTMTNLVELQRSTSATVNLMNEISQMDKDFITKIAK